MQLKLLGKGGVKMGRDTRKKEPQLRDEAYVLPVGNWDCDYDFAMNNMRPPLSGSYPDFRHLRITGRLIRPERFAGRLLQAVFLSEHNLRDLGSSEPPRVVGRIQPRGRTNNFEIILNMPEDVLTTVVSMLIGERWQYLILHGTQLTPRLAQVQSYRFTTTCGIEDSVCGAARTETD